MQDMKCLHLEEGRHDLHAFTAWRSWIGAFHREGMKGMKKTFLNVDHHEGTQDMKLFPWGKPSWISRLHSVSSWIRAFDRDATKA